MSTDQPPLVASPVAPLPPHRQRLADTRLSLTHKFKVGDQEGYITVGLYPDGRPGEVFIKMSKQGSTTSGLLSTIGVLTSLALQYGVAPQTLADKFAHMRFEPSGRTGHPELRYAHSIVDYIFRWLGLTFGKESHSGESAPSSERFPTTQVGATFSKEATVDDQSLPHVLPQLQHRGR